LSAEAVRYLLIWGAQINALDDKQFSPLHLCIRHAEDDPLPAVKIAQLLLQAGANQSLCDYLGKRPADYIQYLSDFSTAQKLTDVFSSYPSFRVQRPSRFWLPSILLAALLIFAAFFTQYIEQKPL
jgi:ankyrin repeat protein